MYRLWWALVFIFFSVDNTVAAQSSPFFSIDSLRACVSFLASDSLKGRGSFTPENKIAASYIADEFKRIGLEPLDTSGSFLQSFFYNKKQQQQLHNVLGVIPGQTKPGEFVFITAHYDHIGAGKKSRRDYIYNGANDNASGTAAMLAMAKYFAEQKNNERTIVFIAFDGEELGLRGSYYLSSLLDASSIIAMFNLEMLGRPHEYGNGKIMVTGFEYSNLGKIMQEYCKDIEIIPDDMTEEKMFIRCDSYPFALKQVPAHTFMCFSRNDATYHWFNDEEKTFNFYNFSRLVAGLVPGIQAIVSGIETPRRLKSGYQKFN